MPQPAEPFLLLTLGRETAALSLAPASGGTLQLCANIYDLATRLISQQGLCQICFGASALTPDVLRFVATIKKRRPDVALYLAPGGPAARAEAGARLGLLHWEDRQKVEPAIEAPPAPLEPLEDAAAAKAASQARQSAPPAWVVGKPNPGQPIVVRMAPKPSRNEASTRAKADNPKVDMAAASAVEADALTRYDEMTGQPLLTDEELKALLEDPRSGE